MRRLLIATLAVLVLAQLIPVDRVDPPVETEVPAPDDVRRVLVTSCYDCHSHETRRPWYAWVAPVSWLVAYDIQDARGHLNFSTWNRYTPEERAEKLEEVWEEVEEGEMPLWRYLPLHPDAQLDDRSRELIREWSEQSP